MRQLELHVDDRPCHLIDGRALLLVPNGAKPPPADPPSTPLPVPFSFALYTSPLFRSVSRAVGCVRFPLLDKTPRDTYHVDRGRYESLLLPHCYVAQSPGLDTICTKEAGFSCNTAVSSKTNALPIGLLNNETNFLSKHLL